MDFRFHFDDEIHWIGLNEPSRVHEAEILPLVSNKCSYIFQNKSHNNKVIRQPNIRNKSFPWKRNILFIVFMINSVINCVKLDVVRLNFISNRVILTIPLEGALTSYKRINFTKIVSCPTVYYMKKVYWYIMCLQRNVNNFETLFFWLCLFSWLI